MTEPCGESLYLFDESFDCELSDGHAGDHRQSRTGGSVGSTRLESGPENVPYVVSWPRTLTASGGLVPRSDVALPTGW